MSAEEPSPSAVHEESPAEEGHEGAHAGPAVPEIPFDRAEIAQFEADDVEAGKTIGKMLALLFLYTVLAMTVVGTATYLVVSGSGEEEPAAADQDAQE